MKNIKLNVTYYTDGNKSEKETSLRIFGGATIAEFLDVFFQQTGVQRTQKFQDWKNEDGKEIEIPYMCQINDIIIDGNNENEFLSDWNIHDNSNVTVVVGVVFFD